MEEPKIIKEGNYSPSGHNASSIVNANGISPAVMENHGTVTAVVEPKIIDNTFGYDSEDRVYSEYSPTIRSERSGLKVAEPQVLTPKRTEFGKAVRKQYESHEIEMSRHDMTTMVPRTDGVSNTLTSVQKDNYLAIAEATAQGYAEAYEGDSVNLAVPNSKARRGRVGKQIANTLDTGCQQGVVVAPINPDGECSRTIKAQYAKNGKANFERQDALGATGVAEYRYRIRKLTPRECFRLMGVDDADIDKLMNASISNTQLYKCAGNSIVVDVLYHLFRKLYIHKGCEQENFQQKLF